MKGENFTLPWQQSRLFRFFASLRLAMLLLAVLIVATVAGTIYESKFDSRIAGAYIYRAAWFNIWLVLLSLNLLVSALSRMPWKRHHTGFLLTHLGIIVLLAGSLIGRTWGIEGTMTLFKSDPPSNRLVVDERVLQIVENDRVALALPLEIIHRKPSAQRPWLLAKTPSGWEIAAVGYAPALDVKMEPKALAEGGAPALHITLATAMMGQQLDAWLLADDPAHGTFDFGGLASISFKKGTAPGVRASATGSAGTGAAAAATDIEEAIFAFAKSPAEQVSKALKGGNTGAKIKLVDAGAGTTGTVRVELGGKTQSFDLASILNKTAPIPDSPFTITAEQYWPDFRIENGKPMSATEEPNNPCVLVTLRGHAAPVAISTAESADGKNRLVIYTDENGALTYELASRKAGVSSGRMELNNPLPTGWADWKLTADQPMPHAEERFMAKPAVQEAASRARPEGVLVRATRAGTTVEQWVPLGWQISLPTTPKPLLIGYGFRQVPLPISLKLQEFEVERNEGSDSPAGFKSTLAIYNMQGDVTTGQCWMNHPISYPGSWLNTFSGLTYKISQASWNPENPSESTVQILRDPGWGLKWIGSLVIVVGIFILFYLRPYPADVQMAAKSAKARVDSQKKTKRESAPVEV